MLRCYLSRNTDLSVLERKLIGQLFFRIAEVLDIQDEDVVCIIDFYVRKSPTEPGGIFTLTETGPYTIKLANIVVEPRIYRPSPLEQMGQSLAHEMIHLKQRLRDGLTVHVGKSTSYYSFKGQTFFVDGLSTEERSELPFEKETHALAGEVYERAVEVKSQTALVTTTSHAQNGDRLEAALLNAGYDRVGQQAPDDFVDLLEHLECVRGRMGQSGVDLPKQLESIQEARQQASRDEQRRQELQKAVWAAARKVAKHATPPVMEGDLAACRHEDIVELRLALENHDQWGLARVSSLLGEIRKGAERLGKIVEKVKFMSNAMIAHKEAALGRLRRNGKRYRKGDKVYIINRSMQGPYYFEGRATVIRLVGVGGRYLVDFGNGTPVQRIIHDEAQENLGHEIDRLNRETNQRNGLRDPGSGISTGA
jgi:hypothetical protein